MIHQNPIVAPSVINILVYSIRKHNGTVSSFKPVKSTGILSRNWGNKT
jgi:hypothetical protein